MRRHALTLNTLLFFTCTTLWVLFSGGTLSPIIMTAGSETANAAIALHGRPDAQHLPISVDDLMIVAHYDDEALAEGGFIASEIQKGKSVIIVQVSFSQGDDSQPRNWFGQARHFDGTQWGQVDTVKIGPKEITDYAIEREQETGRVLDMLGVKRENRIFLRYPDASLEYLVTNPDVSIEGDFLDPVSLQQERYLGSELIATLTDIINHTNPSKIITHFHDDTNLDHQAVGRLVQDLMNEKKIPKVPVWKFLVHWLADDAASVDGRLPDDYAWLAVSPETLFQIPSGTPTFDFPHRVVVPVSWSQSFLDWKKKLVSQYRSQNIFEPRLQTLFAKKNELLWDAATKTVYDFNYISP